MLPTGTVTFLFTDIQGSTPLWEREPEKMAEALQIHNAALRRAIEANGGVVFKTVGDAFQAAFSTAPQALKAAIEGQRALEAAAWNELGALKVRMGLHTGEAELDAGGDEYAVSHTKNRIGRIHSVAHGGQILLSQETFELVRRSLPEGVTMKDLGEHRLKGMEWLEHLYQACVPRLPQDFPSLATTIAHPNNLPVQLTSFIGREKEIQAVCRLLETHRLVTLTGSGGTGKTRLSLQVAADVLENYLNGVWLVELAPLADPELIPKTVSSALNLPEISGKPVLDSLVDFLRAKRLLLILDNCEHLLEACASLTDKLLHTCPDLTILASSREFLGVTGEAPYRVPPMALPDLRHLPSLEALSEYDSVCLFVERARMVSPDFAITENNAAGVAQVVNRLDGIPLALELAASRLRLLGIEQISQRLKDTFRLLTGGSRTALPRHQTLRASIDWSYNLLTEPERILLRRLSVFSGGWRLQAAESICAEQICSDGSDQSIHPEDILDLLSELVDKSLVNVIHETEGRMRYRMLETIRQYAHEKLVDEKEAGAVRKRLLVYYLELAEALEPKLRGREQIQTLDRLELELDNLRLALEWGLHTDVEAELRLAVALLDFWFMRYHSSESIDWLERGLEEQDNLRAGAPLEGDQLIAHLKAMAALGFFRWMQYYHSAEKNFAPDQAKNLLEEVLSHGREAGLEHTPEIQRVVAWTQVWLSGIFSNEGDPDRAQVLALEALSFFRQAGDPTGTAESLQMVGYCEVDPIRAKMFHQEQLAVGEANGDVAEMANAFLRIGVDAFVDGEYEEARSVVEASLEHFQQINDPVHIAQGLWLLGVISHPRGDLRGADQYYQQSLVKLKELGIENMIADCLFYQCLLDIAEGSYDQAGERIEAVWKLFQKTGIQYLAVNVFYIRARLARLQGDISAARNHVEAGLNISEPGDSKGLLLRELGLMELKYGDLRQAGSYLREGVQTLIPLRFTFQMFSLLDGLADQAVREQQMERAARLLGSRWCRGYFYYLSPIERTWREADLAEIKATLGEERYNQLYEEGKAMTFMQAVALVLEEHE